jgi:hypothetical protein
MLPPIPAPHPAAPAVKHERELQATDFISLLIGWLRSIVGTRVELANIQYVHRFQRLAALASAEEPCVLPADMDHPGRV